MTAVVDVWLVDTRTPFESTLDAEELRRRDALRLSEDRRRFDAAHSALRRILEPRVGAVRWSRGPNGKPHLAGEPCQVNLSHAGEWAAIAVTDARPVGVDLQDAVAGLDYAAMARRFFPPAEAEFVAARGAEAFALLWARKEAVVKAAGDRLTRGLLLPVAGDPPPAVTHDGTGYTLADLAAPDGFRAAVALAGPEPFSIRRH
ncbi:4'-phosphopantetheinyl transferase superfamily protein [Dactylosporangium sp. NPDC000244]|uniref:4'-phosphopantetheinyl transferase family protein n=1 Tax=Dactylosporangium sp. NPDC000244 TaxID=3154365 RepID=UPI00331FE4EA